MQARRFLPQQIDDRAQIGLLRCRSAHFDPLDYSFDFSRVVSPWFTFPSTLMSSRKLSSFTKPRPTFSLISFRSVLLTTPSAFTSPVPKVMVAEASTEPEAPFTPGTVTVISEPSQLTCPSSTVTVEPLIVVLLTRPQLVVVVPETLVTGSEKVNTMVCRNVPPLPTRHSTPGVPV